MIRNAYTAEKRWPGDTRHQLVIVIGFSDESVSPEWDVYVIVMVEVGSDLWRINDVLTEAIWSDQLTLLKILFGIDLLS